MKRGSDQKTTRKKKRDPMWGRLNLARCSKSGKALLERSSVSVSVPAGRTHRGAIEAIAASVTPQIRIASLADELDSVKFIRIRIYFGPAARELDKIAQNYPNMQWWISDEGLTFAIVLPEMADLSTFDCLAGRLTAERFKDKKLSRAALLEIATAIDAAGFELKSELQLAQRKPIALFNQEHPKNPIKTFSQAVRNARLVRGVRRRLYLARTRFEAAQLKK